MNARPCVNDPELWWDEQHRGEAVHQCLRHCPMLTACQADGPGQPESVTAGILWAHPDNADWSHTRPDQPTRPHYAQPIEELCAECTTALPAGKLCAVCRTPLPKGKSRYHEGDCAVLGRRAIKRDADKARRARSRDLVPA